MKNIQRTRESHDQRIKGRHDNNVTLNRVYQQRVRNYKTEPNGNAEIENTNN